MLIYKGIFTYFFFVLAISRAISVRWHGRVSGFGLVEDAGRRRSVSVANRPEVGCKPVLTEGEHSVCSSLSSSRTMHSPNFGSGTAVTMKGTGSAVFSAFSTCSICTLTPPVLMVLSFRPKIRNCPWALNSQMSFVISFSAQTAGASIVRVFSGES